MDEFPKKLLSSGVLWRHGKWLAPVQRCGDIAAIARHLSPTTPVIPSFRATRHFYSTFIAALLVGVPLLLLSNRSASTLNRLKAQHQRLVLATDGGESELAEQVDDVLIVGSLETAFSEAIELFPSATQSVLEAYTSGSTGEPRAYSKTWSNLLTEADTVGKALALGATGGHVITTVPLHHMYGFTYAFFGPLRWGMTIDDERPVYPRDLARVLSAAPSPSWVVTTPTHLRAYVASAEPLPALAGFICSTAPLSPELASAVEQKFGCPIIETYGSTETGAMAWRYPTKSNVWNSYDAITVTNEDRLCAFGPHLPPGGQCLDDVAEIIDTRRFRIIGRATDLVKIAGKRASIAELSNILTSIEGVEDGVFVQQPIEEGESKQAHLAAFMVSRRRPEDVLTQLRKQIEPLFLPRPLISVPRLPRNENGKLPVAALEELLREHMTRVSA